MATVTEAGREGRAAAIRSPAPGAPLGLPVWGAVALGLIAAAAALGLHGGLFRYDFDSYQYVSVAKNLAQGRGPVGDCVGLSDAQRRPRLHQPPLYPALASLPIRAGVSPGRAGGWVSLVAAAAAAICCGLLLGTWSSALPALAGVATAAFLAGWVDLAVAPLTETLFVALCLAALLCAERLASKLEPLGAGWVLLLAVLVAAAFWTRFLALALVVMVALRLLPLLWESRARPSGSWVLLLYITAAALLCLALLLINAAYTGYLAGADRAASGTPVIENAREALAVLGGQLLPGRAAWPSWAIGAAAGGAVLATAFAAPGLLWLWLWAGVYLAALVAVRSLVRFDAIDARLVMPAAFPLIAASVCGVMQWLWSLGARVRALRGRWWRPTVAAFALLVIGAQVRATVHQARGAGWHDDVYRCRPEQSRSLAWALDHTRADDVIVVNRPALAAMVLPPSRRLILARHCPGMTTVTAPELARFRAEFGARYLVLARPDERLGRGDYGELLTALARGSAVPGLHPVARFADGTVYDFSTVGNHLPPATRK